MDATCTIQDSIHVFRLVHKYVSRILGTYQSGCFSSSYVDSLRNRDNRKKSVKMFDKAFRDSNH